MDQIAEAIWSFGREFFGADRRRDHRLDQSVVSMVLSEPSETHVASIRLREKMKHSWLS